MPVSSQLPAPFGYLLGKPGAEVRQIAAAMRAMDVERVSAAHCAGEATKQFLRDVFGTRHISAGVGVEDIRWARSSNRAMCPGKRQEARVVQDQVRAKPVPARTTSVRPSAKTIRTGCGAPLADTLSQPVSPARW